jgi:hypothetical protein
VEPIQNWGLNSEIHIIGQRTSVGKLNEDESIRPRTRLVRALRGIWACEAPGTAG